MPIGAARSGPRPIPSMLPHALLGELSAAGVVGRVIGSAADGASLARDLDLVVDPAPDNLARLAAVLEQIGTGEWRRAIRWLAAMTSPGVVHVATTIGPLDLHRVEQ